MAAFKVVSMYTILAGDGVENINEIYLLYIWDYGNHIICVIFPFIGFDRTVLFRCVAQTK